MMRRQPLYIGVTGYMKRAQVDDSLRHFRGSKRELMAGYLASSKTLVGLKNKHPSKYPPVETIRSIVSKRAGVLNLIHYSTDEQDTLTRQLVLLTGAGGDNLHGFQLNITWPDIGHLRAFHKLTRRQYRIILQIGGRAMESSGHDPKRVFDKIEEYADGDTISDILIDSSGGNGIPFDETKVLHYLEEFVKRDLPINFGVAGGLGPETMGPLAKVLDSYPYVNIDAEGKLIDPDSGLMMHVVDRYLKKATAMMSDLASV